MLHDASLFLPLALLHLSLHVDSALKLTNYIAQLDLNAFLHPHVCRSLTFFLRPGTSVEERSEETCRGLVWGNALSNALTTPMYWWFQYLGKSPSTSAIEQASQAFLSTPALHTTLRIQSQSSKQPIFHIPSFKAPIPTPLIATMTQIKIAYGGASFSPLGSFRDEETVRGAFEALKRAGITTIDTARLYEGSEVAIGQQPSRADFIIDTKIPGGFSPGSAAKDAIIKDAQDSLDRVKIKQFDVLYLHAPDDSVPIAETLEGINEVYKKGIFKRFGLSNFTAEQVQEAYDIAKEKGYVLPSVYQGNYSPVARHLETLLFPTLRKLGFAFYAYSPLAGGFLTKTTADLDAGVGRFNPQAIGGMYKNMYDKPSLRAALAEWNSIAEAEGISKAELAYRWVGYNSALDADLGDAVIYGASKLSQIEETARGLKKGSLSAEAQKRIDAIWQSVKDDAPVDNFGANKV